MKNATVRTVAAASVTLLLLSLAPVGAPKAAEPSVFASSSALWHDPNSPVLGDTAGDVTIVEFSDYACSYCKAVEPRVEALLKSDHHVKLILKEFPILTPESLIAARAALAASRQGKYAQFHQALMGYRGPWASSVIFQVARQVGLDVPRLRRDMTAPAIANEIIVNFNLARSLRIFQSPGFIVGNRILAIPSGQIDFAKEVAATRRRE